MAEPMDMEEQIALFRLYADKDCIACRGGGHSYNFTVTGEIPLRGGTQEWIEPCWCLDLLIQE